MVQLTQPRDQGSLSYISKSRNIQHKISIYSTFHISAQDLQFLQIQIPFSLRLGVYLLAVDRLTSVGFNTPLLNAGNLFETSLLAVPRINFQLRKDNRPNRSVNPHTNSILDTEGLTLVIQLHYHWLKPKIVCNSSRTDCFILSQVLKKDQGQENIWENFDISWKFFSKKKCKICLLNSLLNISMFFEKS